MKALYFLVLGAVLAVGLALWLVFGGGQGSKGEGPGVHAAPVKAEMPSADTAPGAKGATKGPGAAKALGTLSVRVTVLSPDGSPAAGASLALSGREASAATCGADGTARIAGLAPGYYDLLAKRGDATGAKSFELERSEDLGTLRLQESVAIRGHVYDSHEKPVAGASVEAVRAARRRGFDITSLMDSLLKPESLLARAKTDSSGAYELRVPKSTRCSLRAIASGFSQESESPRRYAASVAGMDFHLFPGAVCAGRVVAKEGGPLEGARVMLVDSSSMLTQAPKVETTTAADGTFNLTALPSRQLVLLVRAAGYSLHVEQPLHLPDPDLLVTLEKGMSVSLRTVDGSDPKTPVPGIDVFLALHGSFARGKTGADGRLLLPHLPVTASNMFGGRPTLLLWGGGFVPKKVDVPKKEAAQGLLDLGDIPLAHGGVVTGRVTDKETGKPIQGALVRGLGGLDRELMVAGPVRATTDADGRYELTGVPLNATMVLASHPDYASDENPMALLMQMGGRGGGTALFEGGSHEAHRDLQLTPAAVLEGLVVGPDGNPVEGARVHVVDPMGAIAVILLGSGPGDATSDAQGRFRLKGLKQNQEVMLQASHHDYGSSKQVQVKPGEAVLTLHLTAPLLLKGRVVDEQGAPVAGVRVSVSRQSEGRGGMRMTGLGAGGDTVQPTATDEKGEFSVRNAPPGELSVRFSHPRYAESTVKVTLQEGSGGRDLGTQTLKRGAGIEGVAVDESGRPLPGVAISASLSEPYRDPKEDPGRRWGQDTTDAKGQFALYGLAQGEFQLEGTLAGRYAAPVHAQTGTHDVRLVFQEAGRLRGIVLGENGPLAGVRLEAQVGPGNDSQTVARGWTGADGTFELDSLPRSASFRLVLRHQLYRQKTVENVQATDAVQQFVMDPGVRIGGTVVDPDGNPVQGANLSVTVTPQGGKTDYKWVTTDADGTFRAGGLKDGTITVQLETGGQGYISVKKENVSPGDMQLRIVAVKGESISGTILHPDGSPAKQAHAWAVDSTGNIVGRSGMVVLETGVANQSPGHFEVGGLPPGKYTIRATMNGMGTASVPNVAAGTKDLRIQLPAK